MIKRLFDIILSALGLLFLLPLLVVISVIIMIDTKGPIIYSQERLGRFGKPFSIYKFRTMVKDAEPDKPLLSYKEDERITCAGRFLRRFHLDELPQLWNILVGEMSFVGPRPERKYFVDQIIETAPEYSKLFQVRPGLSSWGMVKYGYASDIAQMIERMNYDLIYIDKMSFWVDVKIMVYTIKTVLTGKGI